MESQIKFLPKNDLKIICCLASLLILLQCMSPVQVLANDRERLNISAGYITGMYAQYRFYLPSFWEEYVTVERIRSKNPTDVVEEIRIYCKTITQKQDPALLLSFKIYETRLFNETQAHDVLIKAKYYTIGINKGIRQPFKNDLDKNIYSRCYEFIDSTSKIKSLFEFPEGAGEISKKSLFVGGENMGEVIINKDNINYVPMRLVCEKLGYSVNYLSASHAVKVEKNTFSNTFSLSTPNGIQFLIKDNTTYISTAYFYRILDASIEIDNNQNIYIR